MARHRGKQSSKDNQLSGLAGNLVSRGIPAVIAMRREISMDVGFNFTRYLYTRLVKNPSIDAAVNEARHRLYMEKPERIDWSSPVLYMRLRDGLLLSIEDEESEEEGPAETKERKARTIIFLFASMIVVVIAFPSFYFPSVFPFPILPSNSWKTSDEIADQKNTNKGLDTESPKPQTPPAPAAKITLKPIQTGSVGIGALNADNLQWSDDVAQILSRKVREHYPGFKPAVISPGLRPKLTDIRNGDLSAIPGGAQSPFGYEFLILVVETHNKHTQTVVNFPTTRASCEVAVVATRSPEILLYQSFNHLGQGSTEIGALEQAFGRCIEDLVSEHPNF